MYCHCKIQRKTHLKPANAVIFKSIERYYLDYFTIYKAFDLVVKFTMQANGCGKYLHNISSIWALLCLSSIHILFDQHTNQRKRYFFVHVSLQFPFSYHDKLHHQVSYLIIMFFPFHHPQSKYKANFRFL